MSDRPKPRLPQDPTGIDQPHDVLAAEEFAMPTGGVAAGGPGGLQLRTLLPSALLTIALLLLLRRRRG